MLYKNPRGIGCNKCHGEDGNKMYIASYKDKKNNSYRITAPAIKHLSLKRFSEVLMAKKNKSLIMPTYFLTKEELESIYYYITNKEQND